jgi:hypothetical protein
LRRWASSGINQGPIISTMLAGWAVVKGDQETKDKGFAPRRGAARGAAPRVPRQRPARDFNPRSVQF